MSIDSKIFDKIKTDSDIIGIFGSGDDMRIYPRVAPAGITGTYSVYFTITRELHYNYQGRSDIERQFIQFSVYGESLYGSGGVRAGADVILAAIEGLNDSDIQAGFHESEQLLYEEETKMYHIALTVAVWGN